MDTLARHLQDALSGAFTIERELGGGGMSRVFLAHDVALDRRVVVKVLPAEMMAGASLDRFRREIQVAARLQHANIVPVLSAGELDGAPYYTMPFVEGQSLREHLREHGALPVSEVVTLMKDVGRALVAAHGAGVVHRDIKPENILLSGGAAMVADFGIAKAIVAARTSTTAGRDAPASTEALTVAGMSLGTPAYMAPEQAAGDPSTDHRADLYALGVIAYEALAGQPLFEGRTAQELVVAHMTQAPAPLASRRPDTPPGLAALIMRCLAKDPNDRPSSAAEVLAAVDAGAAPASERPRRRIYEMAAGALGLVAMVVIALRVLGVWPVASLFAKGVMKEHDRVVVTDFRSVHADSTFGAVLSEAVRTALGQSNAIAVVAPGDVSTALKLMRHDPAAPLDLRAARDVALRAGAKAVVDGDVSGVGGGYIVSLRLVTADSGQELAAFHAAANDATGLIAAADKLARELRGRIGESLHAVRATPPLAEFTSTSIEALRFYAAAGVAERNSDVDASMADLRQAVRLDSTFGIAWADLAVDLRRVGLSAASDSAVARAYALRDHLMDYERLWVTGQYLGGAAQRDPVAAENAWQQLVDEGDSTASLSNLATLLLNRRDYARALPLFMASDRQAHDGTTRTNLAAVLFNLGRASAAESLVAELRKDSPKFLLLPMWEAELAYQRGDYAAVARIADSARASAAPVYRVWGAYRMADLALERGQVARYEQYLREARGDDRARGAPVPPVIDSVLFAYRDVWMSATPAHGVARLDAAVGRPSVDTAFSAEVQYLIVAAYAMGGHADRARAALARYDAAAALDTVQRRLDAPVRHRMLAEIALADGRWTEAVAEFRRSDTTTAGLPAGTCRICVYAELGRAFDRAGMPDSAIAAYEQYVKTPLFMRGSSRNLRPAAGDPFWLPGILRRLGALYDARGDRQRAADAYARFVALWSGADPEFQPIVASARARLAALRVEGK